MNDRSKSFGYRFALLYRLNCSLNSEKMERLGISTSQIPFLSELFLADGPLTQDQLSKRVVIDKAATATGMNKNTMNTPSQSQESGFATLIVASAVQFLAPFMMSSVGIALPAIGRELSANAVELGRP